MRSHELRPPSFWKAQAVVWAVYLVMIYATFLPMASESALAMLLAIKGARTVFGFSLSSLLRLLYRRVLRTWTLPRFAVIAALASAAMGVVWTGLALGFVSLLNPAFDWKAALPRSPKDALDYTLTLAAWSAAYCVVKYWFQWQQERERALQAVASANLAELQLLRYQLNPHFLFNALNSVRATVEEDTGRAKRMITALAEFLRYSLLSGEGEMVELREEMLAIRNYLAIESARFEQDLEVRYDVDPAAESATVPPFLVCALVENAVKHGMRTSSKPLRIVLSAKLRDGDVRIEVANTGALNGHGSGEDTRIGIRNVRERVLQTYGGDAEFSLSEADGWVRAALSLPREPNGHGSVLAGGALGRDHRR